MPVPSKTNPRGNTRGGTPRPFPPRAGASLWYGLALLIVLGLVQMYYMTPGGHQLAYSEFNTMVQNGQIAEVVIGVDTHVQTHSAAAVDARTGGVLGELTVPATPDGYQVLVDFADEHSGLRAWAVEGTGGHGAGLARLLAGRCEVLLELEGTVAITRKNAYLAGAGVGGDEIESPVAVEVCDRHGNRAVGAGAT